MANDSVHLSTTRAHLRLPLTAFLLRVGNHPANSLLDSFATDASFYAWANGSIKELRTSRQAARLAAAAPGQVVLLLLQRRTPAPRWETFIEQVFGLAGFASDDRESQGAIVYCSVADPVESGKTRWIAWTFGSGSRALIPRAVDPRFGLIASLNRIGESGLRQLQYQHFGAYKQRTSHRAGRDTPLGGFPMERLTDLLSGVGGRTEDTRAAQVFGKRSLQSRGGVGDVTDFLDLAAAAMKSYRDSTYRRRGYSFIDDYKTIDDERLIERLRSQLFDDIRIGGDNVDIFIPDDLVAFDDERAIQFILFPHERVSHAQRTLLTMEELRSKTDGMDVNALDWNLRFLDANGDLVKPGAAILECLVADLRLQGSHYLISDGEFLQVNDEFVARLNHELDTLDHTHLELPHYAGGTEPLWNQNAAEDEKGSFICVDSDDVTVEGETPFEAADLIHVSGALIHVKRKGRSSALSYLFVQARRSCQFFSEIPDTCEQVRQKVKAHALDEAAGKRAIAALSALDHRRPLLEVVLVILGDWRGRSLHNLPLLAKVELMSATRRIARLGFTPTVALVGGSGVCRPGS